MWLCHPKTSSCLKSSLSSSKSPLDTAKNTWTNRLAQVHLNYNNAIFSVFPQKCNAFLEEHTLQSWDCPELSAWKQGILHSIPAGITICTTEDSPGCLKAAPRYCVLTKPLFNSHWILSWGKKGFCALERLIDFKYPKLANKDPEGPKYWF